MSNGKTISDFPQLGDNDCKSHNLLSISFHQRCNAMEKTLYDDKYGLTRIIPVVISQNRLILGMFTAQFLTVIGAIIGYFATKGGV